MKSKTLLGSLFLSLFLFSPLLGNETTIKLTAEPIWDGTVSFVWTDSLQVDATGYRLYYRKNTDSQFTKFDPLSADMNFCNWDRGGKQGEIYIFCLQALRKSGLGWKPENSNPVTVTITRQLPVDSNSKEGVIDIAKQTVMGGFPDPAKNGLSGYNIFLGEKEEGPFVKVNPQPLSNVPSYLVKNLVPGKKYYFNFTSVALNGTESHPSKNVTFTATTFDQILKGQSDKQ